MTKTVNQWLQLDFFKSFLPVPLNFLEYSQKKRNGTG